MELVEAVLLDSFSNLLQSLTPLEKRLAMVEMYLLFQSFFCEETKIKSYI